MQVVFLQNAFTSTLINVYISQIFQGKLQYSPVLPCHLSYIFTSPAHIQALSDPQTSLLEGETKDCLLTLSNIFQPLCLSTVFIWDFFLSCNRPSKFCLFISSIVLNLLIPGSKCQPFTLYQLKCINYSALIRADCDLHQITDQLAFI